MTRVENVVVLIGHIASDITYKEYNDGMALASFTLAVPRPKGKNGQDYTDFIRCSAWNATAVFVNKYFQKGKKAAICGELNINSKKNDDGEMRSYATVCVNSITFADSAPTTKKSDSNSNRPKSTANRKPALNVVDDDSEELPWS